MASDIVTRLRNPPFGTETSERNLMSAAADAIDARWRPIADAPEHTSIILCCWWVEFEKAYPFVCEGYLDWDEKTWRRANDIAWDETKYTLPTHWQPLPVPPTPTPAPRLAGTPEASTIGEEAAKIVANLRPND